ncbi:hypothetical protein [Pseudoclavibacter endophyticus]|uniref:Uncharacterized protein n=1 Tax=Pseudoclavibacter endophyticus TaxID=1778590 RepID=A0A6H9WM93_9MICO|nr:hypothetical protein [Pseudoclavibacter endophyticus]KAB1650293.1 hypothetical protein F8O04_08910 [Pseudoclavibacter endophyticus]
MLTLLLAPEGPLAGVRDVLADWSAAGLVDDFHWVEPAMLEGGADASILVRGGELLRAPLQSIAGRERIDGIRLGVLVPALDGVTPLTRGQEQDIVDVLDRSFAKVPVTRVRAIVTRADPGVAVPGLVVAGWHNVVISPEDSTGPGLGRTRLDAASDTADLGRHAASGVAGLLGLWSGVDRAPLDGERVIDGQRARLARSYFRRLATDEVTLRLREGVLSVNDGLPLPSQFGVQTVYVDDVAQANENMATRLWAKHATVLRGPRETHAPAQQQPIGAGEALRMFFGFLWAAIKNAPRAWLNGLSAEVSSNAAGAIQGLVYGREPAAYSVFVQGVTANGLPASWLDYRNAASSLDRLFDEATGQRELAAYADLSGLWQDYAAAALTLGDAGERVPGLTPIAVGGQPGVIRNVEQIVPSSSEAFADLKPHVAASVNARAVEPFDALGTHDLENRIRVVAEQPALSIDASGALDHLQRWKGRYGHSFAARVGGRIAGAMVDVQQEIRGLFEQIHRAATSGDVLSGLQQQQRQLATIMQVLAIMSLVGITVTVVFGIIELLQWWVVILVVLGILAVWFGAALIVFMQGQRALFAIINRRREVVSAEEVARRNLRHALRDARRLGEAYGQFLGWSRVIGGVLANPFGERPLQRGDDDQKLTGMPMSTRVGTVAVDETHLGNTVMRLRRDLFATGWLTECWNAALEGAGSRIGPRGVELEGQPQLIFRERGDGDGSLLHLWGRSLIEHGMDPTIGERKWQATMAELQTQHANTVTELVRHVRDANEPSGPPVDYATFMAGLDSETDPGLDRLDDRVLSETAQTRGRSGIERSVPQRAQQGLDRVACLTQLSQSFDDYELVIAAPLTRATSAGPVLDDPGRPPSSAAAGRGASGHRQDDTELPGLFGGSPF